MTTTIILRAQQHLPSDWSLGSNSVGSGCNLVGSGWIWLDSVRIGLDWTLTTLTRTLIWDFGWNLVGIGSDSDSDSDLWSVGLWAHDDYDYDNDNANATAMHGNSDDDDDDDDDDDATMMRRRQRYCDDVATTTTTMMQCNVNAMHKRMDGWTPERMILGVYLLGWMDDLARPILQLKLGSSGMQWMH